MSQSIADASAKVADYFAPVPCDGTRLFRRLLQHSSGRHFDAPNRGTLAHDDSRRAESFSACT
jgi:hypothetical protein